MGVPQPLARLQRHLLQQLGRPLMVGMMGDRPFCGQRSPHHLHGHGQGQLPAIPPAAVAQNHPCEEEGVSWEQTSLL